MIAFVTCSVKMQTEEERAQSFTTEVSVLHHRHSMVHARALRSPRVRRYDRKGDGLHEIGVARNRKDTAFHGGKRSSNLAE